MRCASARLGAEAPSIRSLDLFFELAVPASRFCGVLSGVMSSPEAEGHGPESRDEELDVRSFDFGSNLGSSDERDQSWSKIDDHGREEREWYREAAEAAPGPQDCEETRPCRSQQRSQRAPGPYAAPAVHPAVAQSLFEEKRKSPMKFPWEVGFGKVVFQKESYGHLRFPFELPLVSCQNDVIGAFGSRRKLGAFAPLPC